MTPAGLARLASNNKWILGKHLALLNRKLVDIAGGRIKRLAVFMPPRHGKSEFISKYFTSWYIGNFPDNRIILTSYEASFASSWGGKTRDILEEYGEKVFGVNVSRRSSASDHWTIEGSSGGMSCAGMGGAITGKGCKILIIDDPLKNQEQAQSKTIRDKHYEWYQSTAYTRLEPDGAVILIMTRWNEDDLAGRLLKDMEGEEWEILSLPALAESEDDLLGREIGEPLFPERFTTEALEKIKKTVGSYWWAALYQQRPAPLEGNLVKREWWKFYKVLPNSFDQILQSWDCTFKDNESSDFVVGQVWGRSGANFYLLDQVRGKMNITATMRAIETLSAKWPLARSKLIEDKANGPAIIELLKNKISGLTPVDPQGGKLVRAQVVIPYAEAGNIYLPDPSIANWVHDYIEEWASFPNGKHDDMVDSTSQAIVKLEIGTFTPWASSVDWL